MRRPADGFATTFAVTAFALGFSCVAALACSTPAKIEPKKETEALEPISGYACDRFWTPDPSKCDDFSCGGDCSKLNQDCFFGGWIPDTEVSYDPGSQTCTCTFSCTPPSAPPPPPPPPPCVPTCNNNCGGADGCGGTCPVNDYCTSCGTYSRCGNYYCGDCPPPPPPPYDPCAGDGCDISCCSVDSSNTYWCCGG